MRKITVFFVLIALLCLGNAPTYAQEQTILDVITEYASSGSPEFGVFLTAILAADPAVQRILSDPNAELTLFAPTDSAFDALLNEVGQETFLSTIEDPKLLSALLRYHVVDDRLSVDDLHEGAAAAAESGYIYTIPTLLGQSLDIYEDEDGYLFIDYALLVEEMTEIETANGVIHVIDTVLLPADLPVDKQILDLADLTTDEGGEFHALAEILHSTDLMRRLSDPRANITLLAPIDSAFESFEGELSNDLLLYHALPERLSSHDIREHLAESPEGFTVTTLQGDTLTFTIDQDGVIFVNGVMIVQADIDAQNGVIHAIDGILMPPTE